MGRAKNQMLTKEKQLFQMTKLERRDINDEKMKASSIVTDKNFINSCNIVIRSLGVLKDRP